MSTELEKYLKNKRSELDTDSPDDEKIWGGIEGRLGASLKKLPAKPGRKISMVMVRNIAASVIIILSLAYITNDIIKDKRIGSAVSLTDYDLLLGEREAEYRKLVSYRENELKSFDIPNNEVINQIFSEIRMLDQIYQEAMSDLKEIGNDDQVVNTIFNVYERKIQLLELVIIETNKTENHENIDESAI